MKETTTILIMCEGINDLLFIEACLKRFYDAIFSETYTEKDRNTGEKTSVLCEIREQFQVRIRQVKGCNNLSADPKYIYELIDNLAEGGQNIVIFDADKPGNGNNGFDSCSQKLDDIQKKNNVSFGHFLWPGNNGQNGEIEDLLVELIPEKYKAVYSCIEAHQECLQSLTDEVKEQIKFAGVKDKVGYYLYTLKQGSQASVRDYTQSYWDLNPETNEALRSLKAFFDSYFEG